MRGQCSLKVMLGIQFLLFLASASIIFYDYMVDDVESYFAFHSKLDFFYLTAMLWMFCASTYFLWHSTNRSIVVDLMAYCVLSMLLNMYICYRSVYLLFFSDYLKNPADIVDN